MKILKQDKKEGLIALKADTLDDIWILSRLIDKDDTVISSTTRIVKKTADQEGKRVKLRATLKVEKIEFQKNLLRVLGTIIESSNSDVPHGSFHTITLEQGDSIDIKKEVWQKWQLERIKDAVESTKKPKLILCAADYGDATISIMKEFGVEEITDLSRSLPGKKKETLKLYEKGKEDFLVELAKLLDDVSKNQKVNKIVFGGVGFLSENFGKILEKFPELKNKISLFKISAHGKNGINELIKSGAVEKVVKGSRIAEETRIIEQLFERISKEGAVTYGLNDVKKAIEYGAVETLLVSDEYIQKLKERGKFDDLNKVMESAEKMGARIMIISEEHESGERFSKIQIGALLRFKI